jgi:hypothetical protein
MKTIRNNITSFIGELFRSIIRRNKNSKKLWKQLFYNVISG